MGKNLQTYLNQARDAYQKRSFAEAESHLLKALALDHGNAQVLHNLGVLHDQQQDYDKAADYYRQALAADPDNALIRRGLASLCFEQGEHEESRKLYTDLIRANVNDIDAHFAYSRLAQYRQDDAVLGALQAASGKIRDLPPDQQIKLCFTIGKAHQDLGEFEQAFEAFRAGNDLHYRHFPYDETSNFALLDDVQRCFDARFFETHRPLANSDECAIFILGMPRSGSTLVEQVLASHSKVSAAGEVKYLKQCIQTHLIRDKQTLSGALPGWSDEAFDATAKHYLQKLHQHGNGRARIVDKMPGNYAFIGLITLLFPRARIVHTIRHPMATLWSNYSTLFGDALHYTYNLDVLTRYYLKYREVMAHWESVLPSGRVHTVEYERMIRDPEGTAKDLLSYLELPWEPGCLDFHATRREIKTASLAQVRQPLYTSAVDLWRNYGEQLRPYQKLLESA